MTLGSEYETIEVWTGIEEIDKKSIRVMAKIRSRYDLCVDATGLKMILGQPAIKDAYRFETKTYSMSSSTSSGVRSG